MKKYIITLFLSATLNVLSFGQCPKPDPLSINSTTGVWEGVYTQNGEFINFTMQVEAKRKRLSARVDIPQLKVKNISYQAKICRGQELHVENTSIDSSIEFIARPKENGTMSGRVIFRQNGGGITEEVFTAKRTALVASK
ncbi:MAG: hypothetical protein AAFX57_18290 [Bacteroidota bacterium]